MIALVEERRTRVGIGPLCEALGLARATFYRRRGGPPSAATGPRARQAPRQALTASERTAILTLLHEERFVDLPPAQIWAQVLDAGQVPPCSIRTMYRVLAANAEVREQPLKLMEYPPNAGFLPSAMSSLLVVVVAPGATSPPGCGRAVTDRDWSR